METGRGDDDPKLTMQKGRLLEAGRVEQGKSDQTSRVRVLLATYNGQRFLDRQLRSLAEQTWPEVDILASDDGSADRTLEILHQWQQRWSKGEFRIVAGPRAGFVENFRSLMTREEVDDGFIAFCDQDDEWDPDKLDVAIAQLRKDPGKRSSLYCGRSRYVTADGAPMGLSPLFSRPPGFRNAIVQSIGGGNTMVMNRAAFEIIAESARRTTFVTHDWWTYIMISGAGGLVHYDPAPHIAYRQHAGNLIGHNTGWRAKAFRLRFIMRGRFALWNSINLTALGLCSDLLTGENRMIVKEFDRLRRLSFPGNLIALHQLGLYRQTRQGNAALVLSAALGLM